MKLSENFEVQEFVPKEIYAIYGDSSIQFIDRRIVILAQGVRDFFRAQTTINNWHTGGHYNESGFRHPLTETGAKLSPHKRGIALDLKIAGRIPEEVRSVILKNQKYFMSLGVTRMESETLTWCHLDLAWTDLPEILVFKP